MFFIRSFAETKKVFHKEFLSASPNKFLKYPTPSWFVFLLYNNALGRNKLVLHKSYGKIPELYEAGDYRGLNKKSLVRLIKRIFHKPRYLTIDGRKITSMILKHNPSLFCINDSDANDKYILEKNRRFLEDYFPKKSKFEI